MNWYVYTLKWCDKERRVMQQMTPAQAHRLGAKLVPRDEVKKRAEPLVVDLVLSWTLDGALERNYPMTAEAPAGRL